VTVVSTRAETDLSGLLDGLPQFDALHSKLIGEVDEEDRVFDSMRPAR